MESSGLAVKQKTWIAGLIAALSFAWNWHFLRNCSLPMVLKMNDVSSIIAGYRLVPHLWPDSLAWWHGRWIEVGIPAFRPLASYLYWYETWIGLHWGFVWVGWLGLAMLIVLCWLTAALAWRLTRSLWCTLLAGVLAPGVGYGNGNPDLWLAWYPVHQELLLMVLLLGALLCFDTWFERGETRFLVGTWLLYLAGCLTKEYMYIFPAFALVIVTLRTSSVMTRRQGLAQVGWMLGAVAALWVYRSSVIAHPRNPPPLKRIMLIRRPFLFFVFPFYRSVLTQQFWFPGLALLLCVMTSVWLRLRRLATAGGEALQSRQELLFLVIPLAVVIAYCAATYSVVEAFWYLCDGAGGLFRVGELGAMIGTLYSLRLIVKYRREAPAMAAFALVLLSYAPVFTYLGWHYTLPGWFLRSAYWPVVAQLAWIDVGRPLPRWPVLQAALPSAPAALPVAD